METLETANIQKCLKKALMLRLSEVVAEDLVLPPVWIPETLSG